jgi:hypothetical protein
MKGPKFPIISIYNNSLNIISSEMELTHATVIGIIKGSVDSFAFDTDGNKWNYYLKSDRVKDNFRTRLLANTIYNPVVNVIPQWNKTGSYHINELKDVIKRQINQDDDILTQFVEPETLKQAIDNSNSFEEICKTLNKYVFNFELE